jgi:hypothetical protein
MITKCLLLAGMMRAGPAGSRGRVEIQHFIQYIVHIVGVCMQNNNENLSNEIEQEDLCFV